MGEIRRFRAAEQPPNGLTSVYTSIHCPATHKPEEIDEIAVNHFLKTLAEVAMTVASRERREGCEQQPTSE